ncbi:MAG: hypothetical protein Q7T47_06260, partial [Anaerolineales bacterium]|nr:hypothetical protein [Anaerolineales bacterium]
AEIIDIICINRQDTKNAKKRFGIATLAPAASAGEKSPWRLIYITWRLYPSGTMCDLAVNRIPQLRKISNI